MQGIMNIREVIVCLVLNQWVVPSISSIHQSRLHLYMLQMNGAYPIRTVSKDILWAPEIFFAFCSSMYSLKIGP